MNNMDNGIDLRSEIMALPTIKRIRFTGRLKPTINYNGAYEIKFKDSLLRIPSPSFTCEMLYDNLQTALTELSKFIDISQYETIKIETIDP